MKATETETNREIKRLVEQHGLTEAAARELVTEPLLDLPIGPDGKPKPFGRLEAPAGGDHPVPVVAPTDPGPRPTSGTAYYRFRSDDGELRGLARLRDGAGESVRPAEKRWVSNPDLLRYWFNPPSEGDLVPIDEEEARRVAASLGVELEAPATSS
jgi:hypothetical protein